VYTCLIEERQGCTGAGANGQPKGEGALAPTLTKDTMAQDVLDRMIELHRLLWQDGGGVITYENLFLAQEIVDNYLLDMASKDAVTVKQNLDGRIISVQRRAVR